MGSTTAITTIIYGVPEAVGDSVGIATQILDFIVGNPIVLLFLAASVS